MLALANPVFRLADPRAGSTTPRVDPSVDRPGGSSVLVTPRMLALDLAGATQVAKHAAPGCPQGPDQGCTGFDLRRSCHSHCLHGQDSGTNHPPGVSRLARLLLPAVRKAAEQARLYEYWWSAGQARSTKERPHAFPTGEMFVDRLLRHLLDQTV